MTDPMPPADDLDKERAGSEQLSLLALFTLFLGFGLRAFGGPVAQIAMLRQTLVDERGWLSSTRFNRLLAVLQVLPGPEAHELCVHMGMIARGRMGGVLAGLGFMLPGFLLMLGTAWLYVGWVAGQSGWSGVLTGIQIVVLAIILRAIVRIGEHIVVDTLLAAIAVGALCATVAGVPFWISLLTGGTVYALAHKPVATLLVVAVAGAVVLALRSADLALPSFANWEGTHATTITLFLAGLKGGLLTFGGAYTAIPYVRADSVGRGWLSDATFLDGVALAGILPAPLVIFATFVGYVAGGFEGALAMTAGMFLPAFAFSLLFFERLEAIVEHPRLHRILAGVSAAVVGIIAQTLVDLGRSTASDISSPLPAFILFALALLVAWRMKGAWIIPALVAAGALAGWLFF